LAGVEPLEPPMPPVKKIIGIDLGTTNSVVAVMEGGEPKVITNREGSRLTSSVVAYLESGERLVGAPAKRQAVTNPRNTIYSIKRFMGRRHSEVGSEEKIVPYKVVGASDELVRVEVQGKLVSPPEVSAMILRELKDAAEDYLGGEVTEAVITVPAYFNDSQRQATKEAGKIAGLTVRRIVNEPTAAALAYGLNKLKEEKKVAVFDLGGGTFDVSILQLAEGVFEVLSTNGDTHLGGDDFDQVLLNYVADEFLKETRIDLRKDQMALQRLKEACEKAKIDLSSAVATDINLPYITMDQSGPKHLTKNISRAKFEQLVDHLIERCRKPCESAIADAKVAIAAIDEVILVGGSTRIPKVQELVKKLFGREPNKSVNPDEAVALGAAVQGAILNQEEGVSDIVLLDVTPLSLGVEVQGGVVAVLIQRNTTIPTAKKEIFSTAADSQPAVDIHVVQGERPLARDNRTLGKFQLTGIPPAPRGMPKVEVTFDIDANGILNVNAKDLGTGKEQKIQIQASSGLSSSEVDRMVKDAERYASEDKDRKELIELKNRAEQQAYHNKKLVEEHGSKLSETDKKDLEDAIAAVEKAREGEDKKEIESSLERLEKAGYKLSEQLYKGAGPAAGAGPDMSGAGGAAPPPPGGGDGAPKDDVIDADYEVKDSK
jgi:molecular chaperone DnaK